MKDPKDFTFRECLAAAIMTKDLIEMLKAYGEKIDDEQNITLVGN